MEESVNRKIILSNKIYPIFCGLSMDLVFYIAINTLFLTTVKGINKADLNLIATIGTLVSIIFCLLSPKIINKIGNIYSIRIGTLLLLISAVLFTISKSLALFIIADILYEISFIFKCVDSVILNNNLIYQNREKDFIKIKTQATTTYAVATLFASLVSGFLFNINHYLPMVMCISLCLITFIMSHFIYEVNVDDKHVKLENKSKIEFNKIMILSIIVYGLLLGTIVVSQSNDKLFIQYELGEFLETNKIALIMSFILFLSRLSRLVTNLLFNKIYKKLKDKMLYLVYSILLISISLFVFSNLLLPPLYGSIIMAVGFILLLTLRDPTENILNNILLKHTKKKDKEKAVIYFQFTRRITVFILSLLATMILTKYELVHLYILILILVLMYIFVILKLFNLLKKDA